MDHTVGLPTLLNILSVLKTNSKIELFSDREKEIHTTIIDSTTLQEIEGYKSTTSLPRILVPEICTLPDSPLTKLYSFCSNSKYEPVHFTAPGPSKGLKRQCHASFLIMWLPPVTTLYR